MNVSLTPELEAFVRAKVAEGRYNNASEVVREALRLLESDDRLHRAKLDWLKAEVQKGLDDVEAGRLSTRTIDEIIADAKARRTRRS